jgi:hypothetical protein
VFANLTLTNLRQADLRGADLRGAIMWWADLRGARLPPPTDVLQAWWGPLSDDLTLDLMRYDAWCHPNPGAFDAWAAGGPCPYNDVGVERAANFRESKPLWSPGSPSRGPYQLMMACFEAKGVRR